MGVDLLNPAMLSAMGVAAAPFLIHLLSKRRPKNWEFPTTRFLRTAMRRKSRIHLLHDLILLALRTLAVLLLVLTFARPIMRHWAHAQEGTGGNEVLILLDDSLSTAYQGNPSPFDAARSKGLEILESLRQGDVVNLWFLTQPKPLLPHFSDNVGAIETELRRAQTTDAAAQVDAVLESVREFLVVETARSPLLYILSDFQRTNWASVRPENLGLGGRAVLIDTGSRNAVNSAVAGIRIRPANPAVTETVAATCQVAHYGPGESEAEVRFNVEGAPPIRRSLVLPPFGTADVTFHLRFDRPGTYRATVKLAGDRLSADDARTVVFRIGAQIPVLLVTDSDPDDDRSAAYFLKRAVAPEESGLLRAETLRSDGISPERLAPYEVTLISEVKLLSREALEALHRYLSGGGSVVYFLARNEDRGNLLGLQGAEPGAPILPFRPGELFDLRRFADRTLAFAEANYDSSLLRFFRDPENGDLSTVHATRFFTTERTHEMAETLLTYADGTIALAQSRLGAGSLVLANFSPRPDHSDLARRNVFPPLVHEIVKGLRSPRLEVQETHPGEAASLSVELDERPEGDPLKVSVLGPDGAPVRALVNLAKETASVTVPRAEHSGFYNVLVNGEVIDTISVNPDPDESDLRPLPLDGLNRLTDSSGAGPEVRALPPGAAIRELREGKIVWPWVLLSAFGFLLLESTLAHRWRTR